MGRRRAVGDRGMWNKAISLPAWEGQVKPCCPPMTPGLRGSLFAPIHYAGHGFVEHNKRMHESGRRGNPKKISWPNSPAQVTACCVFKDYAFERQFSFGFQVQHFTDAIHQLHEVHHELTLVVRLQKGLSQRASLHRHL